MNSIKKSCSKKDAVSESRYHGEEYWSKDSSNRNIISNRKRNNRKRRESVPQSNAIVSDDGYEELESITANNRALSSYPRACEFCGKICTYRQVFFAHRKRCNSLTSYLDLKCRNVKEYFCAHCAKRFNRKFNLQKHLESEVCMKRGVECCNDPNDRNVNIISEYQTTENEQIKEYTCAHCGKMFKKKCNLQRHVRRAVCSGEDSIKRCKLKCWENECSALFYKQIDLVQHLREQHGVTLTVERLEFQDHDAFQTWKNEENSIKFMNARKLTGSKRSSKGLSYYFVCQFYRKNETESTKRKTNRRKTVGIVPNTKCPSRILVKECGSKVHVTYISTHNHDLYDPLEKKPLSVAMKSLVKKRHISGMKFKNERVKLKDSDSWEITCGNGDKQRTYTVQRINKTCQVPDCIVKCYEEYCTDLCEHLYKCSCSKKNIFCKHMHKVHSLLNLGSLSSTVSGGVSPSATLASCGSCIENFQTVEVTENDKLVYSAQDCLMKLHSYIGNQAVQQLFLKQITSTLNSLCEQCDKVVATGRLQDDRNETAHVPRSENDVFTPQKPAYHEIEKSISYQCFTAPIGDCTDLLKPMYQPFNINLLFLKSLETFLSEQEIGILQNVDPGFTVGWLYDAVIDSFLSILCSTGPNIYVVDSRVSQFLLNNQPPPQIWEWITWSAIDLMFVPCKPIKNHWLLIIILLKEMKLYVLDPSTSSDSISSLFKKYELLLNCWCNVLKNFFGIGHFDIGALPHTKQNSAYNGGVFICWYAFQYVNKFPLTDNINTNAFRKFIHDTITNGSHAV